MSGVLQTASGLFGGIFDSAAEVGERIHPAAWERGHYGAFEEPVRDVVRPEFVQCPRCQSWVCPTQDWHTGRGLC